MAHLQYLHHPPGDHTMGNTGLPKDTHQKWFFLLILHNFHFLIFVLITFLINYPIELCSFKAQGLILNIFVVVDIRKQIVLT